MGLVRAINGHIAGFFFCFLFCYSVSSVTSASVLHMSISEQVERADVVLHGTVLNAERTEIVNGAVPITLYSIDVHECVKGSVESDVVEVPVFGGCINDECIVTPGTPRLSAGDEVILFLQGVGWYIDPFLGGENGVRRVVRQGNNASISDYDGYALTLVGEELVNVSATLSTSTDPYQNIIVNFDDNTVVTVIETVTMASVENSVDVDEYLDYLTDIVMSQTNFGIAGTNVVLFETFQVAAGSPWINYASDVNNPVVDEYQE
jgi:hypothetical protein